MARVKLGNVRTPIEYLKQYFASAGYGLGEYAKQVDSTEDIDTIKSFGAYSWNANKPANAPSDYMCMIPVFRNSTNGTQYFQRDTLQGAYEVCGRRVMADGVWGEFEWINPPMEVGKEYRTIERRQGKAVYTKLVDCGAMPNTESKIVAHNCAAIMMLRCCGTTNLGTTIPYRWNDSYTAVSADRTNIHLCTNADFSGQTCMVQLWYTKD